MRDTQALIDIARQLGCKIEEAELLSIKERQGQATSELILPLVGEFSSGKTTLLNSLTDSKALETATKPTTATIYEIHFGSPECRAAVTDEDGQTRPIALDDLKNDKLADAFVVNLWDTSTRVPSTTVIVDTPGLSSPDPRHKRTLVNFLPKADGILLVVDINAQLSNSLTTFIKDMKLAARPVFLVVTMCDTKEGAARGEMRERLSKECELPLSNIVFVSAKKGDLSEFFKLLEGVQAEKDSIICKVDEARQAAIVTRLVEYVDGLVAASKEDKALDEKIREQASELRRLQININRLITDTEGDVDDAARATARKFEGEVSSRLNALVTGKSKNFDAEAVTMVNSTASLLMSQFRDSVSSIVCQLAQKRVGTDGEVALASLQQQVDLSGIAAQGLTYNIDLNSAGHEYDSWIANGLKVAAAGAVVLATAGLAAPAAGAAAAGTAATGAAATGAAAAGGAAATGAAAAAGSAGLSAIGTSALVEVGEVALMAHQSSRIAKMERAACMVGRCDQQASAAMGMKKGVIDTFAGFISENVFGMGKPQRMRAVSNYIDGTLMPEFNAQLNAQKQSVVSSISTMLQQEAAVSTQQKQEALETLKRQKEQDKAAFDARLVELKNIKNTLLTIN